ncbi:MAG: tRNA lysidine(34) synthetase TilS [Rikenellaceae bacterium]
MVNLFGQFIENIERNKLITHDDKVLLTVSGGVDSMVLLDLFARSDYEIGVAHCNFKLRNKESDEDEELVKRRAEEYGVPHYNIRFDTTAEMERTGESMEMAARRIRYAWFNELCDTHGYTVIAIAHHANDSIETFFINLFRGTGLRGLTGIKTQLGRVVRPLNFTTRKTILEYASTNHIPYREDSSNRSTKYLRNKIRLGLIPRMLEINPKFTYMMEGNIRRLSEAQQFITSCIDQIAEVAITEEEGIYTLHIDRIADNKSRWFVIYEVLNSRFGFKSDVVDSLYNALNDNVSGRRVYAKDYVAYTDRKDILITRIDDNDTCEIEVRQGMQRAFCANSVLHFESMVIDLVESFDLGENVALIDADKLEYPLVLRRWSDGDTFTPLGMSGHKKVSDLLIDLKVSMPDKNRQFVLTSAGKIVWVVGRRIDDHFKVEGQSENILKITKEIV